MKKLIAIMVCLLTTSAFAGSIQEIEGSLLTKKTGILATVIPIKVIEVESEEGKEYYFIDNGLVYEDCVDGVFSIKQIKFNEKDGYNAYKLISSSCD